MDIPGPSGTKCLKVWTKQQMKKAILANSFNELVEKTKVKFNIEPLSAFHFVLLEDGTEVDDQEFFEVIPNNTILMLLKPGETWERVPKSEVLGLLEKIRKRKGSAKGKSTKERLHRIQLGWIDYSFSDKRYKQKKITIKNSKTQMFQIEALCYLGTPTIRKHY